ncbi:MAG TPA: hypothetical protein VMQ59_05730 [Acidimicrobiales bacterium]|jgi:hypothetical protein|nr:hypothetical protein [Acidimicrobiales bacterium]
MEPTFLGASSAAFTTDGSPFAMFFHPSSISRTTRPIRRWPTGVRLLLITLPLIDWGRSVAATGAGRLSRQVPRSCDEFRGSSPPASTALRTTSLSSPVFSPRSAQFSLCLSSAARIS